MLNPPRRINRIKVHWSVCAQWKVGDGNNPWNSRVGDQNDSWNSRVGVEKIWTFHEQNKRLSSLNLSSFLNTRHWCGILMMTYICPPSNFELTVTTKAPTQTTTNTSANCGPPSWLGESDACNILWKKIIVWSWKEGTGANKAEVTYSARKTQRIRGPHKSPTKEIVQSETMNKIKKSKNIVLLLTIS